jgi:putative glutamine amidotransferase
VQSIIKAGGLPILIPTFNSKRESDQIYLLKKADGILIPGGNDIDPILYGEQKSDLCGPTERECDEFLLELIRTARQMEKPLLGICKGCQLLNVAYGGTLYQDQTQIPNLKEKINHMHMEACQEPFHTVFLERQSQLSSIFNSSKELKTNSLHHQSIKKTGNGLRINAYCIDGTIEGIETLEGPFCLGIQWHPEVMYFHNDYMKPIFSSFIKESIKNHKINY